MKATEKAEAPSCLAFSVQAQRKRRDHFLPGFSVEGHRKSGGHFMPGFFCRRPHKKPGLLLGWDSLPIPTEKAEAASWPGFSIGPGTKRMPTRMTRSLQPMAIQKAEAASWPGFSTGPGRNRMPTRMTKALQSVPIQKAAVPSWPGFSIGPGQKSDAHRAFLPLYTNSTSNTFFATWGTIGAQNEKS